MECTGNNSAKELGVFKSEKIEVIFFSYQKTQSNISICFV